MAPIQEKSSRMTRQLSFGGGVFAAAVLLASSANAVPIATVGAVDTFIQSANLANSGDDTETAWLASVLGVNVDSLEYDQLAGSGASAFEQVTGGPAGTDLYAIDFQTFAVQPAFFLIKTGNLGVTTDDHFLYSNIAELRYGVIDLNDFGDGLTILAGKISHVGVVGGANPFQTPTGTSSETPTATAMPEPTTLLLLGTGFALATHQVRRRSRQSRLSQ